MTTNEEIQRETEKYCMENHRSWHRKEGFPCKECHYRNMQKARKDELKEFMKLDNLGMVHVHGHKYCFICRSCLEEIKDDYKERITELEEVSEKLDDECDELLCENKLIELENQRFREVLEKLKKNPYPDDIFLPLTQKQISDVHKKCVELGFPIDRLSAHIGRRIRFGIDLMIEKALKEEKK